MSTDLREHPATGAARRAGESHGSRTILVLRVAALIEGLALATIVGLAGSLTWQAVRVVLVAGLTALAVWGLGAQQRAVRGAVALLLGLTGTVVGIGIGVIHVTHDTLDLTAVAGLVCLAIGLVLLGVSSVALVRAVPGWWKLLTIPAALVLLLSVLYPMPNALYATNVPRPAVGTATPADRELDFVDAEFVTNDGVTLSGWYLPSSNGAALLLLHGASSTRTAVLDQAAVLAEHGYGVLLYDARGHGRSGGTAMDFGWYGDLDIAAALSYLESRPEVDPARLGAVGMSMGGEQVVGAAATDTRIRAVVGEGVTGRGFADKGWLPRHWRGWVQRGIDATLYGTADVLTDASPPISLRDAVAATAPTPVLLIAGGATMGNAEEDADRWIQAGSPSTVDLWVVPDTGHTAALRTQPEEWRATVLGFLDNELLQ
ncbi:MAG TPA: alpha/beta fold hydrolase [Mycobacterium sp.]|nr:alpha/beta fold hydrolase [Mycobacterium sp.]